MVEKRMTSVEMFSWKGLLFEPFPIHKGLNKKTLERENKLPREKYICLDKSDQNIEMNEDIGQFGI